MNRRRFLVGAAASSALAGCGRIPLIEPEPAIFAPGMREGHWLRDARNWPAPSGELTTDVVILGSGAAGLSAAWKLGREGFREFLVIAGPEPGGNTAGGHFGGLPYPRGAHYLPLPAPESTHIRELLADLGVIQGNAFAARPTYDETVIVHAPDERLYRDGQWEEGLLPARGVASREIDQQRRFLAHVELLKAARGADGRRAFTVPVALASRDPAWTALDAQPFARWLDWQGYTAPSLRWYLDYSCRDDYGAGCEQVSAWAGLAYFAARAGEAANAADGAVLTWPDGLASLTQKMRADITRRRPSDARGWQHAGLALRVREQPGGVEVLCADLSGAAPRCFVVRAKRAICAMPLAVATRVVGGLRELGFDPAAHLPTLAPWLVANFHLGGFPAERPGAPLAWDNVVYGSRGLGYVVSTHQQIRAGPPPATVFTTYQALRRSAPGDARRWLASATPQELAREAALDLDAAYGWKLWRHAQALEITLRGHAMATPTPGFFANPGLAALRQADGRVLFAHSDLSGYSVFEEAAWWGFQAAGKILAET